MANSNELTTSANTQVNITSDDYKQVVQRLVKAEHTIEIKDAELAASKTEIESLKLNADNAESVFAKGSDALANVLGDVSAHKISKAGAENFFKVLVDEVSERVSQTEQISTELEEIKTKLDGLENEKRLASRSNKIRDSLGLTSDNKHLSKLVASTDSLSDESFDVWLENTKELFMSADKHDPAEDKKKKEKEEKDKKKNPFAKSADEDGITDTRILDNVVASASAPAGTDNAVQPVSLPERMQTLAAALWSTQRDTSEGGK